MKFWKSLAIYEWLSYNDSYLILALFMENNVSKSLDCWKFSHSKITCYMASQGSQFEMLAVCYWGTSLTSASFSIVTLCIVYKSHRWVAHLIEVNHEGWHGNGDGLPGVYPGEDLVHYSNCCTLSWYIATNVSQEHYQPNLHRYIKQVLNTL